MSRPSFGAIYTQFAHALSARSTCSRLRVGAVITTADHRQVLAIGYNGNAHGMPNECDTSEPGNCGCIHAEANAVIHCAASHLTDKRVFVTHSPCVMCAKYIIQLGGVVSVHYHHAYRNADGIHLLLAAGILAEPSCIANT